MQYKTDHIKNSIATKTYTVKLGDARIDITIDKTFNPKHSLKQDLNIFKTIHYHTDYELFFVCGNSLYITTQTSTIEFTDSVVIVPPYFNHFSVAKKENVTRFMFSLSKLKNETPNIYADLIKSFNSASLLSFPLSDEINVYTEQLNRSFHEADKWIDIKINALFSLLLISVFNHFQQSNKFDQIAHLDKTVNYIPIIENIIQNHYNENIHLDYLAEQLHLSTKQVSRILKKKYNSTLSDMINEKKLSISCVLLKNTTLKINEIINQVGFGTESYFYILFKKKYGMSPLAYRKSTQIKQ